MIAPWQIEMAARPAPSVRWIVPRSTPVVSFGDPLLADVATLGINPSRKEFYDDDGSLLRGARSRLATTDSIGARPGETLTKRQASEVVAACNTYFERNPYDWFNPLEDLLHDAVGVSFRDGTACHLDLIQWATDPVWTKLKDASAAELLLREGRTHLAVLLRHTTARLVLMNGMSVIKQVKGVGMAELRAVKKIPRDHTTCTFYVGRRGDIAYIGWSTNLQSSHGVSNESKRQVAEEVKALIA